MLVYSDYKTKDVYFREILRVINMTSSDNKDLDYERALTIIRELASSGLQATK